MVKVISGKTPTGEACLFYLDGILKDNLDDVKVRVIKKGWDYVSIICGIPGAGKSNFSQSLARYLCPWFNESYIAFTDNDFIRITNSCPEFSAVVLDESFQSLNARVTNSSSFLRIVNHLQLVRQKHLFIFLCLPNFFDLSKGIALYRTSHLFLVYPDQEGNRGRFCAFDRDGKRELYIKGNKFQNYNAVNANFIGRFTKQKAISEERYEQLKKEHLLSQDLTVTKRNKDKETRDKLIYYLANDLKVPKNKIVAASGLDRKTIYNVLNS